MSNATSRFRRPKKVGEQSAQFINALVYGKSGVGKTTLAATCPGPVLILDCEQGLSSLSSFDPAIASEFGITLDKDGAPVDVYFEPVKNFSEIRAQVARIREENTAEPGYWGTVVLDSLTEMQRFAIGERLQAGKKLMMEQQDWGIVLLQCETAVRDLRALPVNTLFIAQEKEEPTAIGPDLSGQVGRSIARHLDVLARYTLLEKEEEKDGKRVLKQNRVLRMRRQLTPPVECKCRYHMLGDWEKPNFAAIIQKIKGEG